jgi:hypothetical protein
MGGSGVRTMGARSAVIKQATVSTVLLAVMMAVFYASAGRTDIPKRAGPREI